ncbi:hypothetical protein [Streptomyces acidicola]|uniref:hypothetical protein n=1 Tax=Streptomyces acidicola TaxID=2596892 RepID=UPI00380BFB4C
MAQKDETTYDFPKDLIKAQDELEEVRGELKILLKKQSWSVEPLAAWTTHENHWRASSRPDSPGWDPADQLRIGTLRKRELEALEHRRSVKSVFRTPFGAVRSRQHSACAGSPPPLMARTGRGSAMVTQLSSPILFVERAR